jgi:hypothetical protein
MDRGTEYSLVGMFAGDQVFVARPSTAGLSGFDRETAAEMLRALLSMAILLWSCMVASTMACAGDAPPASFVGRAVCAGCHRAETAAWQGSHHDKAMQEATEQTVLGDFNDATTTHFGVTSTFLRKDEKFVVRTDGPDGTLRDYEIAYTFGVYPLQQYLTAFPGGRYQVLPFAWDSRSAAAGGQHWFHLYPKEALPAGDALHWTGMNQNWNFMCCRLPLDEPAAQLRCLDRQLSHVLVGDRRVVRGLSWSGLPSRRLGEG